MRERAKWALIAALAICGLGTGAPARAEAAPMRLLDIGALGHWAAVGRVNVAGQAYCTGTLIAPDLVATAAHCLYHPVSRRLLAADRVHFVAGWTKGAFVAHGPASGLAVHPHYAASGPSSGGLDLALLRLRAPFGVGDPAALSVADPDLAAPVTLTTYGRGRSQALEVQARCPILRRSGAHLAIGCETVPGGSGGPVVQAGPDGTPRLIAVISGITRMNGRPVTIATVLAPEMTALIPLSED